MAMQVCPSDPSEQQRHVLPPPPQSPASSAAARHQNCLLQELSFTALPKHQQQQTQQQQQLESGGIKQPSVSAAGAPSQEDVAQSAADMQTCVSASARSSLPQLQLAQEEREEGVAAAAAGGSCGGGGGDGGSDDDRVLFDAELASYISETDYFDLRTGDFEVRGRARDMLLFVMRVSAVSVAAPSLQASMQLNKHQLETPPEFLCCVAPCSCCSTHTRWQVDSHLVAELAVVRADNAALEEEKAAAQVRQFRMPTLQHADPPPSLATTPRPPKPLASVRTEPVLEHKLMLSSNTQTGGGCCCPACF